MSEREHRAARYIRRCQRKRELRSYRTAIIATAAFALVMAVKLWTML